MAHQCHCAASLVLAQSRHVAGTLWEIARHRRHLFVFAHLEDERHADLRMELDVTVEQPVAGIVGDKAHDRVAAVRHGDRIFGGCTVQASCNPAGFIERLDLGSKRFE